MKLLPICIRGGYQKAVCKWVMVCASKWEANKFQVCRKSSNMAFHKMTGEGLNEIWQSYEMINTHRYGEVERIRKHASIIIMENGQVTGEMMVVNMSGLQLLPGTSDLELLLKIW